jgi:hypothetical protein
MNRAVCRKFRRGILLGVLLGASWLPVATRAIEPSVQIKLLIIKGVSNHDRKPRLAWVREILARDGSFAVDVTTTPATADQSCCHLFAARREVHLVVVSVLRIWPPFQAPFKHRLFAVDPKPVLGVHGDLRHRRFGNGANREVLAENAPGVFNIVCGRADP